MALPVRAPSPIPQDVQPEWLNVVRRIQASLPGNQGYAIITIRVLVDSTNRPRFWTAPEVVKIEPKNCRDDLLVLLSAKG